MRQYLSQILEDEKYFVCCRCGVPTNLKDSGITIDDVIFSWDFDTDEEANKYLKANEYQRHINCDLYKEE